MRGLLAYVLAALCAAPSLGQQPAPKPMSGGAANLVLPAASELNQMFEEKVKSEWDALKNKDKKSYGELLADDYEGVELDGNGERTKMQALNEVPAGNVSSYTLWGLRVTPVGREAAFVIYEVTMRFPPGSALHYSRLYISELWVKREGQWKELHYQETHVR